MTSRHRLSVCPHDTAKNLFGWFVLNTYMQRLLSQSIHFEPADNFIAEREAVLAGDFDLVYANPYSALLYVTRKGFVPVAKVSGLYDETLLVKRKGAALPASGEVVIASATDKLIVHPLGQTLLPAAGIDAARVAYKYVGTHPKAAQAVMKGEAWGGFVFNETWRGLAASTKAELEVLGETQDGTAFHCFCVGPQWADRAEEIRQVLVGMNSDKKGRDILADLGFGAIEAIDAPALDPAIQLMRAAGLI
ncbi:MAG: phosphate/phosphite/phosphonate ABC transporter substrate-binding protein [Leptothrix sp. (in: b-proteobacteria)]